MRLYVGNLSYDTTEDTLRELFSNYGKVISVSVIRDSYTGDSRGFGFVDMGTDTMGERGIGGMNGKTVDGRRLRVMKAVEKEDGGFDRDDDDVAQRGRRRFDGRDDFRGRRYGSGYDRRNGFRADDRDFEERRYGERRYDERRSEGRYGERRYDDRRRGEDYSDRRDDFRGRRSDSEYGGRSFSRADGRRSEGRWNERRFFEERRSDGRRRGWRSDSDDGYGSKKEEY